jgi:signal transduction histidine kinase
LLLRYLTAIDAAPDAMRYVVRISEQISRLNGLIERLLDASRIQLGRLVLEKSKLDLVDIARTVAANAEAALDGAQVQGYSASAQEGQEGYAVKVQGPPEGVKGEWDAARIEQVLTNLVDNALRYSPPGAGVEVRVSRQGREARVEVADRGPGVPPEQRPDLFDRYYQGPHGPHDGRPTPPLRMLPATQDPHHRASRRGSLGLGLHISSEIVKAHGGRIGMEPNPGGGSIFWFTVPLGISRQ